MHGAVELVRVVYNYAHPGPRPSWPKVNSSLRAALNLAIESGMKFARADVAYIHDVFKGDYWFGDGEWILEAACVTGNTSATVSFAAWKRRSPFLWHGDIGSDLPKRVRLPRLFVGARFYLDEERFKVTSFPDGKTLIACSYTQREGGAPWAPRMVDDKVKSRRTLTAADIRSLDAANKPKKKEG